MAEEISPALLAKLQKAFAANLAEDKKAANLLKRIQNGKSTYAMVGNYAQMVGEALAKALKDNLSADDLPGGVMDKALAEKILTPLLEESYRLVSTAAVETQTSLNKAAEMGIKAQTIPMDKDRAEGLVKCVSRASKYDEVAEELQSSVVNFSRAVVDDTLKANVDFQGKMGLRPQIVRRATPNCCPWCARLAGSYSYYDVPKDVYKRHLRCNCTIEFDPGDGKRKALMSPGDEAQQKAEEKARQKRIAKVEALRKEQNSGIIEARKNVGLNTAQ